MLEDDYQLRLFKKAGKKDGKVLHFEIGQSGL